MAILEAMSAAIMDLGVNIDPNVFQKYKIEFCNLKSLFSDA